VQKIGPTIVLVLFGLGGCASVGQNSGQPWQPSSQAESFGDYLSARLAASDHNMADAAKLYGASLATDPTTPTYLGMRSFIPRLRATSTVPRSSRGAS